MSYIPDYMVAKLRSLDCREVAHRLNIPINRYGKALCFIHGEREASLHFNKNGASWYCYGCKEHGDSITLVQKCYDIDFVQACQLLGSWYGISVPSDEKNDISYIRKRIKYIHKETNYRSTVLGESNRRFNSRIGEWIVENAVLSETAQNFLFKCRKIRPEVADMLNIGSISDANRLLIKLRDRFSEEELVAGGFLKIKDDKRIIPIWTPCLLIPYYNEEQQLVGLQTRYLGNHPDGIRYLFIGGTSPILFNSKLMSDMKKNETLLVCEGPTDCMALLSAGYKAVALPSATIIPSNCENRLADFRCRYIMDRDEAGRKAFRELRGRIISKNGWIDLFEFPKEYKDYGEYYAAIN